MSTKQQGGTIIVGVLVRTFFAAVAILLLTPLASGWLAWFAWFVFAWLVVDLSWSTVKIAQFINKKQDV